MSDESFGPIKRHNKALAKSNAIKTSELKKTRRLLANLVKASKEYKKTHGASIMDPQYISLSDAISKVDAFFNRGQHVR